MTGRVSHRTLGCAKKCDGSLDHGGLLVSHRQVIGECAMENVKCKILRQ